MAVTWYLCHAIWLLWQYNQSQISMVVSDGLAHIRHPGHLQLSRWRSPVGVYQECPTKWFNQFSSKRSWHIFKWNLNQFLIYFTTICFRRNTFENTLCTILALWPKTTDQNRKIACSWFTLIKGCCRAWYIDLGSHLVQNVLFVIMISKRHRYRGNNDVNIVACVHWKGSVSCFGSKTGTRTL